MISSELKNKLLTLPHKPGCYLHKSRNGEVIYVGKAVDLFNRVNSYFRGAHNYKTAKLVSEIEDFDYIITNSEHEALVLEYNLIKEFNPKYNIAFKDDSSYPYILLSDSKEPFVKIVRPKRNVKPRGKLFGPYTNVDAARKTLSLINEIFPTRKCDPKQKNLCLYYHIGQCPGYCVKKDIDNSNVKKQIEDFLLGKDKKVVKELNNKMLSASEVENYEQAAYYKDLIDSVVTTAEKQSIERNRNENFDVFNYYVQDNWICVTCLIYRKGKIQIVRNHIDYLIGEPEEITSKFIYDYYLRNPYPKTIFIPEDVIVFFDNPVFSVPKRGFKRQLLLTAGNNGKENLEHNRRMLEKELGFNRQINEELARIFGKEISTIEVFDNSHTGGKNTVGGLVRFTDLKVDKKGYRLFKLEDTADDFYSMKQMLSRHFTRLQEKKKDYPDLIIVDGAKPQLQAAKEVLEEFNLDICLAGLGKDEHHNTSYLMNSDMDVIEVDKKSNLFFFLTNIQDEVHRFAITYHKKLRSKDLFD